MLEAKLQVAQAELEQLALLYQIGRGNGLEYQAAQEEVDVLKAELAGDPVKVAEIRLRSARGRLKLISQLVAEGRRESLEQVRAEGEVAIAQARLEEAKARAAGER